MTVEEFERQLGDFGQNISNLDNVLLAAGGRLVEQIKRDAPVDTGALRNSIKAIVQNNRLTIGMLIYGMFQNYGVNGQEQRLANIVQDGVLPRPTNEPYYAFGVRKKGLRPQNFFNVDAMSETLAETLAENIINNL